MSGKAGRKAAQHIVGEPRPEQTAPEDDHPDAAGAPEPMGMPTSDRMATETAHHHPGHHGDARNDGEPGPAPSADS